MGRPPHSASRLHRLNQPPVPVQHRAGLPNAARPRIMPRSPGRVAQLVEQGIENPRVGGSIPSPATRSRLRFVPDSPKLKKPAETRVFCCPASGAAGMRPAHRMCWICPGQGGSSALSCASVRSAPRRPGRSATGSRRRATAASAGVHAVGWQRPGRFDSWHGRGKWGKRWSWRAASAARTQPTAGYQRPDQRTVHRGARETPCGADAEMERELLHRGEC